MCSSWIKSVASNDYKFPHTITTSLKFYLQNYTQHKLIFWLTPTYVMNAVLWYNKRKLSTAQLLSLWFMNVQYFRKPVLTSKFNWKSQNSGIILLINNRHEWTQNRKMSIFFVRVTTLVIQCCNTQHNNWQPISIYMIQVTMCSKLTVTKHDYK